MNFKRARKMAVLAALAIVAFGTPSNADLFGYKSPGMHPDLDGQKGPKIEETDFVRYARKGYGSIKGHLGVNDANQNGNEILYGHSTVLLVPATPYTKWYFMNYLTADLKRKGLGIVINPHQDRLKFAPFDTIALKYTRTAETDADGRYQFMNLPSGQYYVIAFVRTIVSSTNVVIFDGYQSATYKAEEISLLGDDPPLDISGDRAGQSTALVRIVPSLRLQTFCAIGTKLVSCNDVVDLDQFLGARSEY